MELEEESNKRMMKSEVTETKELKEESKERKKRRR